MTSTRGTSPACASSADGEPGHENVPVRLADLARRELAVRLEPRVAPRAHPDHAERDELGCRNLLEHAAVHPALDHADDDVLELVALELYLGERRVGEE